jgi:hypothetical protein
MLMMVFFSLNLFLSFPVFFGWRAASEWGEVAEAVVTVQH